MTYFWIWAVALIFLALVIVVLPIVWRPNKEQFIERLNTKITQQRFQELEQEKQEGLLTEQQYAEAEHEVKIALGLEGDADSAVTTAAKNESGLRWSHIAIFTLLTAVSVGIYWQSNSIDEIENWLQAKADMPSLGKRVVMEADASITPEELQQFALGLRTKLQGEPGDAVGWLLLGRVLVSVGDVNGGISAFEKSYEIEPKKTGLLISFSQALLLTNDEANVTKARNMLSELLKLSPENTNARGLMAIAATRLGDKELAIKNWRILQGSISPNDPMFNTIQMRINELNDTGTRLIVNVNITDELRANLPSEGFLFVFAQDADSAMRMPAAVKKIPLSHDTFVTGVEVVLDTSAAMVPNYNLENLNNARLIARISFDEKVDIASGELQGELNVPINKNQTDTHSLIINQEL